MKKLIFNITFHWQIEQLKYHLNNLFSWNISSDCGYVITTAHKNNFEEIKKYCSQNFNNKNIDFLFIEEDHGHHNGTTYNVFESIKYIDSNKNYDYIVNIEADNMFFSEKKLLNIISKLENNNKHMLLIEEGYGKQPHNVCWPELDIPKYLHITTLNIYSKYFIQKFFPKEYYFNLMNFGWCGQPGTPFEAYLALSIMKKNNITEENQMDFWNGIGLRLDYDRNRIIFPGWYKPDDMTPDKFIKWGIINCPSTGGIPNSDSLELAIKFIELHKTLIEDAE